MPLNENLMVGRPGFNCPRVGITFGFPVRDGTGIQPDRPKRALLFISSSPYKSEKAFDGLSEMKNPDEKSGLGCLILAVP
jgi:hypothetical protein